MREGKLFFYAGGYDKFESVLAEQNRLNMALLGKQEDERRKLEDFVTRYKAKPSKAKQAQSRIKRLEKMQPVATIISDPIAPIDLPSPERQLSPPIIRFDELGWDIAKTSPCCAALICVLIQMTVLAFWAETAKVNQLLPKP